MRSFFACLIILGFLTLCFSEAQFLYDEYLSLSAEREVNAPQTFRDVLEEKLKSKSAFASDFFDTLQLEIYYLMKRDSFRNFVHHKSFVEWFVWFLLIFVVVYCFGDLVALLIIESEGL